MAGFYWYPSRGEIPPGAVKGGIDKNGEDIFIGRAFHNGSIVPAKILPSKNAAFIGWGGYEHSKSEWEVLCKGGRTFFWEEGSAGSVPPNAVPVGITYKNELLYVGRVLHDGILTIGKIHPSWKVCFITHGEREVSFTTYQVLVLNNIVS